jgi:hypothetical protein
VFASHIPFPNMATTFNELLGEHLLQHSESGNESTEVSTNQLNGKIVALYFSYVYYKLIERHIFFFDFLEHIGVHHAEILHQN